MASRQRMRGFLKEVYGNVALTFGLLLPLLVTGLAGSVDYARWLSAHADMQNAADTAALAGAKELRLANANMLTVAAVARSRAIAALGATVPGAIVQTQVPSVNTIQVSIDANMTSLFGSLAPTALSHLHAQATAQSASTPTCLIALDPKGKGLVMKTAALNAAGCATYSDSQKNNGLSLNQGTIQAAQTCSSGGASLQKSVVSPAPITDCPVIPDPLVSRLPPPVGSCIALGVQPGHPYVVSGGSQNLTPGVYCGGLTITNGASVHLGPGIYVINGGKLTLDKQSSLDGDKVGFFLTGNATLDFDLQSNVNLVAPADGPMAGMLFFEDRLAKSGANHMLGSQNAPQLLGTIYFPQGNLTIGAPLPGPYQSALQVDINTCYKLNQTYPCSPTSSIAQYSAWTIIIANQITVNFVLNLQLNTNYSANSTAPPQELSFSGATLSQ